MEKFEGISLISTNCLAKDVSYAVCSIQYFVMASLQRSSFFIEKLIKCLLRLIYTMRNWCMQLQKTVALLQRYKNFLFHITTVYRSHICQMYVVWMVTVYILCKNGSFKGWLNSSETQYLLQMLLSSGSPRFNTQSEKRI